MDRNATRPGAAKLCAWRSLLGVLIVVVGAGISGCRRQEAAAPPAAAIPVVVAKGTQKSMPVQLTAIGNVEAYSTIAIKAQVAGELLDVHFKEGDFVQK